MRIEVRLYATLRLLHPEAPAGVMTVELPERSTVADLLGRIGVDPAKIHILMVNGVGQEPDIMLRDGDRVGLFPPVGGG